MLTVHNISYQLPEQIAGASIRSACLAALVMLIIVVLRLRNASTQHAAWTVVLVSMLALPVASLLLPPLRVPVALREYHRPESVPHSRIHATKPIVIDMASHTVNDPRATRAPSPPVWPSIVLTLYVTVALAFLMRLLVGLALSRRLVNDSGVIRNSKANLLLEEIAGELAEYPLPQLCESDQICVPCIVREERISILLPRKWRDWDTWKLRAVLAHELTHIRRGDWRVVFLAALNRCVFWFHPIAWWLEKRLAALSEQASDEGSVLVTQDPARYAEVLLEVSSSLPSNGRRFRHRSLSALSMAGAHNISRRIHHILELRSASAGVFPKPGWMAIAACALPLVCAIAAAQISLPQQVQIHGDVPTGWQWQSEGFKVSAEDSRQLETRVASESGNLAARAKLIAYYLYNAMPDALAAHVLWLIEHHPDSDLAGSFPVTSMYPIAQDPNLERKRQLWLRQAAIHNTNPRVMGNAAQFLADRSARGGGAAEASDGAGTAEYGLVHAFGRPLHRSHSCRLPPECRFEAVWAMGECGALVSAQSEGPT